MKREFTASVYIIDQDKTLLIYHNKLKKWLPPGGHIEPNETPPEAAIREAYEETGLHVQLAKQENLWIDRWNAKSIERPHLCMLQEIPEHKGVPAHQHIDMAYIGIPVKGELIENKNESSGLRWFNWEEIEHLKEDDEIFIETKNVLKTLLVKQEAYA
jgi:8-oxo-dGTP pyrophosphatase MutT (NUDIX family)